MISFRQKKILVVVAHPDDELLGLGATLNKLVRKEKCSIKVIILGEGITSRADQRDPARWKTELQKHRGNIEKARKIIGYQEVSIYDFPDNRFDSVALLDIIKIIEKEKQDFNPEILFTHHPGDVNIDHQRTYEAVIAACRPMEDEPVQSILTFETPSSTEWRPFTQGLSFEPNFFVAVSEEQVERKIKAMECYEFERRKFPHPRSPEALKTLARKWGIVTGKEYAEAFSIVRCIW
jgi:LmbE family N-acetylglucosaminyl deacetylase